MHTELIRQHLEHSIRETNFKVWGTRYQGKVRDTYSYKDKLILVASDRISAFDHVLHETIPFKGQVLNQLAAYFFEATQDVAPNHVEAIPDPNVTIAMKCKPVPLEFVVRAYLAGHAWRTYAAGNRVLCGIELPEGLQQNSRLPEPILTPATKAKEGHDEDISRSEAIERGIIDAETFDLLESWALALFQRGTEMARKQGLLFVDTKYEFGQSEAGNFLVIDEIHTPDSSRYFYADSYEDLLSDNLPQRQLSKEFVREWLMEYDFMGQPGQELPNLPDAFRIEIAERYIELYESVTGKAFNPDLRTDTEARIRVNLQDYFSLQ